MKTRNVRVGVIIIDMQPKWLGDIDDVARAGLISGIADLIRSCKKRGALVTVVEYADSGRTIVDLRKMVTDLPSRNRGRIVKSHCSAFQGTGLDQLLRSNGVGVIVVAGVHASYCVRETVVDAVELGYQVVTAPDLIADNPALDTGAMWTWYGKNTEFYAHSAELIGIEIG